MLMKDEIKLARLLTAAVKSVKIPVTLKTRIALNHQELLGARLAKLAEDCGAAAVTLHARAAVDVHTGLPNVPALAQACAAVKIPVIGNGGVADASFVKKFIEAGCAGVMIGRAAVGNPFIFQDIMDELANRTRASGGPQKRLSIYLKLIAENVAYYGERIGINRSRKTAGYWISGFPDASSVRGAFVRADSWSNVQAILLQTIRRLEN